jgi:hypothetical protein
VLLLLSSLNERCNVKRVADEQWPVLLDGQLTWLSMADTCRDDDECFHLQLVRVGKYKRDNGLLAAEERVTNSHPALSKRRLIFIAVFDIF